MTLTVESIPTQYHQNGPNGEITRVVIHGTVSPCVAGGARANARYFQSPSAGGAAHYVVDPAAIVSCVDEAISAAHAPPNHGSIGVELTDPQTGDGARWQDADHQSMLALAAELVADVCARHSLPLVWLSPADLLAGKKGITSHANVSAAWHQTDHTDPGPDFPVDEFLSLLNPPPIDPVKEAEAMLAPVVLPDGTLQVFVVGKDSAVYTLKQKSDGSWPVKGDGSKDWQSLGGIVRDN